jgi:hypothetical protein
MERETFIQTIHSIEVVKIWNLVLQALWIQLRLSLVLYYLYWKWDQISVNTDIKEKSKTAAVVLSLVEPLLGNGHTLWMTNFYSAPVR